MIFPNLSSVKVITAATAKRFPLVLTASLLTGIFFSLWLGKFSETDTQWLLLAILSGSLAIPLTFALTLLQERRDVPDRIYAIVAILGVAVLALFVGLNWEVTRYLLAIRYLQLSLFLHLVASIAAFFPANVDRQFWQFNADLFSRFLVATLFAAVLFGGLSICLWTLVSLFGLNLSEKVYGWIWAFAAFVFHPWFFLASIPQRFDRSYRDDIERGIVGKLCRYLLVPLLCIYLLILYSYLVKIIGTSEWPKGILAYLVNSYAFLGVLTLLLLSPFLERDDYPWLKTYRKIFFVSLMPLLALLFIAIWQRVDAYGLTERRYCLVLLGLWLSGFTLYSLFYPRQRLDAIPISLAGIILVTSFGPWGVTDASKNYQLRLLNHWLREYGILTQGMLAPSTLAIPFAIRKRIVSTVEYLNDNHGTDVLRRWLNENQISLENSSELQWSKSHQVSTLMLNTMGIKAIPEWQMEDKENLYFNATTSFAGSIDGFHSYIETKPNHAFVNGVIELPLDKTSGLNETSLQLSWDGAQQVLQVRGENTPLVLVFDLAPFLARIRDKSQIDKLSMIERKISASNVGAKGILLIKNLQGTVTEGRVDLQQLDAGIFFR